MKISYNVFLNVCFFYFFYIKNIYFINNDNIENPQEKNKFIE